MGTWKSCLRFTIREYALLAVIVGLALAWALDHQRLQGSLRYTGNPLDLAIEGEGFFTLTDPRTAGTVYTRRGKFLTDANGLLVVRLDGVEWQVNPAISIPSDSTGIAITPGGRVFVQLPGTVPMQARGQLQLASFGQTGKLKQIAPSLFAETNESGPPAVNNPGTRGVGLARQGMLERIATQKFSLSPWRW